MLRGKPERVAGSDVKFHVNVSIVMRDFVAPLRPMSLEDRGVSVALEARPRMMNGQKRCIVT